MLALSACGQVKSETEYLSKVDDVKEYEDDKLSSILESFDIVPLETNDDCLIGRVTCIKKRNGRYYVMRRVILMPMSMIEKRILCVISHGVI